MERFAIISCCLHLQRYHRVSLCSWIVFNWFISFIHSPLFCVYVYPQHKNLSTKKLQKKWFISKQIRAMCVCVCVCVCEWPLLLSPNFFSDFFFPEFRAEETKTTISKKKKFPQGRKKIRPIICINIFFYWDTRGARSELFEKKNDRPTRNQTVKYPALKEIFNYSINLF